jgi:hypothetical protein
MNELLSFLSRIKIEGLVLNSDKAINYAPLYSLCLVFRTIYPAEVVTIPGCNQSPSCALLDQKSTHNFLCPKVLSN